MPVHEEARELLAEILNRPEFTAPQQDLAARILEWILELIFRFSNSWLVYPLAVLIVAALGVSVFIYLRRYLAPPDKGMVKPPKGSGSDLAGQAMERSRESAAKQNYREALRYLLLSSLLYLDHEGILEYHISKTNGEYQRRLRAGVYPGYLSFAGLVGLYEAVWYGRGPCFREDYEQGLEFYTRLREVRG